MPLIIKRPELTDEQRAELQEIFELFGTDKDGRVDPQIIQATAESMELKDSNPTVYAIINQLTRKKVENAVDFEQFVDTVETNLGDTVS